MKEDCIGNYVTLEPAVLDKITYETIIEVKNWNRELRGIPLMVTEQSPPCYEKKKS